MNIYGYKVKLGGGRVMPSPICKRCQHHCWAPYIHDVADKRTRIFQRRHPAHDGRWLLPTSMCQLHSTGGVHDLCTHNTFGDCPDWVRKPWWRFWR